MVATGNACTHMDHPCAHLPPITVLQMRNVLRKHPDKKSGGYDGWILRNLAALPDDTVQALLDWLHLLEEAGLWPEVLRVNLMALPPKPDRGMGGGGTRCGQNGAAVPLIGDAAGNA